MGVGGVGAGGQYCVAEAHQRPLMEHWGCLLYI